MIRRPSSFAPFAFALLLVLAPTVAHAQQASPKKLITHDIYDSWKSIQGTTLSRDGNWLAYALVLQDGDGELVVRNLKTGTEHRAARGREPVFTTDGRFVAYSITPPKTDLDKAKKAKKKPDEMPKAGVGVIDLTTGAATVVAEHAKSFKVPEGSSRYLLALLAPAEKKATDKPAAASDAPAAPAPRGAKKIDPGSDLVVRDLPAGTQTVVTDVAEFAVAKDATWVAYAIASAAPAADGVAARRLADGTTKTLLSGEGHYKNLTFDDKAAALAFLTDRDDFKAAAPAYHLYLWSTKADAATELAVPAPGSAALTVSEFGRLEFSKDGARLFFGTAPAPKPEPEDTGDAVKVDLWHYKDPEIQPMQKVRAEADRKRSYRAMFQLGATPRFVQLAAPDMPDLKVTDGAVALGISNVPYRQLVSWDGGYDDIYLVSLTDGTRRRIVDKAPFDPSLSPTGAFALIFDPADGAYYLVRTSDGKRTNLTKGLGVSFVNEQWDTPDTPRPYGHAGWTEGEKSVLIYDRYDIWEMPLDGSAPRNLTAGAGRREHTVFRYARLEPLPPMPDPEEGVQVRRPEPPPIPASRPLLLSAVNEQTKASGYFRATLGASAAPTKLAMLDKAFGNPLKAKDADVYVFTVSRFEEFPNLWVSSGAITDMKKVSDANPQQAEYNWGRSELIDYVNTDGKPLKAILTKPENFDPSKKYPLIVYIYEQLTDNLHRYVPPAPGGSSINVTRFASNGYLVLQPDIVYTKGYPGQSALKCVLPATQKVISMGFVDPARVGIQGHSWGGYQISYMITQTNIFRAVEAGASVVNMMSGYGGIRWGTGMSRAFQYEKTQSRIGLPPWEAPLVYLENSPLLWIEKIHTPYLTMANDEDDAVPWQEGIAFFTAMRRLGKEAYMFTYNGEKHGLRQRENQKHWTARLAEYFDYYLKDAPMPEWMRNGVPYLDKGKPGVWEPKKASGGGQ